MKYPLKGLTEEFVKLSILIKDNDSMYKSERPTYLKKEIGRTIILFIIFILLIHRIVEPFI